MAVSDQYLDYLRDQLDWLPRLRIQRMFGGAGLYSGERFFAIAHEDGLFLKADARSRDFYARGGAEPFIYASRTGPRRMNFWSVPADILEDPDRLSRWVEVALESAGRAGK